MLEAELETTHGGQDSMVFSNANLAAHLPSLETQALFGKLVQEINKKIGSGLEFESVLDYIFESLGLLIPYDRMGIALVDDQNERVTLKWVRSKVPISHLRRNYSASLQTSSLGEIFKTCRPRIINDLRLYLQAHPESESTRLILQDGVRSNLTCPLIARNRPIGIVFFSCSKENTYVHEHIDVFTTIAQELALVVEHGRLQNFFSDQNMRAQNLRTVLHDLRAPLAVIQSYLEYCADEDWFRNLQEPAQDIFSSLQKNVRYMFQLLDHLSTVDQVANPMLNRQSVNLREFFQDMIQTGSTLAAAKDISFQSSIDANLPLDAHFDIEKIRRVIINLLTNAIKFSHRGLPVLLSVFVEENRLNFCVKDQGQGISEADIPRLFQQFGRASTVPTEGERSTGLGLFIAKNIVEQHGGQISVESRPGQGSTFRFWIPLR